MRAAGRILRLLTNRAVMGEAQRTPRQAWADYRRTLEQVPMTFLEEPPGTEELLGTLLVHDEPAFRGLWTDAYLAAFALESGVMLATLDRGFRRFPDLDLILL